MQQAIREAYAALAPLAHFEDVRSQMGGNTPTGGSIHTVHAKDQSADLTVEHLRAAQSAMAMLAAAMEQQERDAATVATAVGSGRRGRPATISDQQVIAVGEQIEAAGKRVTGYTLRAALGGVGRTDRYTAVWERHLEKRGPQPASDDRNDSVTFDGEPLLAIAHAIATQDNRLTKEPIFAVQQKRRIYGFDPRNCDGDVVWVNEEGNEAIGEERANLEGAYWESGKTPDGWMRCGYCDIWEFVTACFTEQGCRDYLARDGHNLKEPRIHAYGSFRNAEWHVVRDALLSLQQNSPTSLRAKP